MKLFRVICLLSALIAIGAVFLVVSAASDCGCGGLPDASPPSGWSDAGNAAMDSYSGFSSSGGGTTGGSPASGSPASGGSSSGSGDYSAGLSAGSDTGLPGASSGGGSADDAVLLTSKGLALFRQGDFNNSLIILNSSLSIDPYSPKTWLVKGDVLAAMGRPDEAIAAYDKVIHLDPGDPVAYVKTGDIRMVQGKYTEAVTSYDHALADEPGLTQVQANRTKAADLATGLVRINVNVSQNQTIIPVATNTLIQTTSQPPALPSGTKKAPLPVFVVISAFGIAGLARVVKKKLS